MAIATIDPSTKTITPRAVLADELVGLTKGEAIAAARARFEALVAAENEFTLSVAAIGDAYGMDADDDWEPLDPRDERWRRGPAGMPGFSEFAGAELGPIMQTSIGAADYEIRSVLVVRHRHPRLWQAVREGRLRWWQAKRLIGVTGMAGLSLIQARWLDAQLDTAAGHVSFHRLMDLAAGLVVAADTDAAEQRRLTAARARYVRLTRDPVDGANPCGLAHLEVRGSAHDLIMFNAMVDHVADLLAADGDTDPKVERRATAVGVLANPAQAVLLLQRHHSDPAECETDDRATALRETALREPDREPSGSVGSDADALFDPFAVPPDGAPPPASTPPPDWLDEPDPHADHRGRAAPFADLDKIIITPTPAQLRPRAVLHVHLSADTLRDQNGVVRVEQIGAITAQHARDLLRGCRIRLGPVIDLAGGPAVDAYEATGRLREQVVLRDLFDVFPFGERPARQCDLDHASPFRIGQSGQSRPDNLNPLSRNSHRAKTLGGWRRANDSTGKTSWTSPTGQCYLVEHGRTTVITSSSPDGSAS